MFSFISVVLSLLQYYAIWSLFPTTQTIAVFTFLSGRRRGRRGRSDSQAREGQPPGEDLRGTVAVRVQRSGGGNEWGKKPIDLLIYGRGKSKSSSRRKPWKLWTVPLKNCSSCRANDWHDLNFKMLAAGEDFFYAKPLWLEGYPFHFPVSALYFKQESNFFLRTRPAGRGREGEISGQRRFLL